MHKDYIKGIEGAERRYAVADMKVEKRAATDAAPEAFVVEGYAAVFNSATNIASWFDEEILPGAFDDVLSDDVRALFNHDPNYILARSGGANPTLELGVDTKGLWYRYTTPNRTYAADLSDAISTGDVSQSSFAFGVKEAIWIEREDMPDLRQIKKLSRLYDVSPVTYPAYNDATVDIAKRSHDAYQAEKTQKETPEKRDKNKGLSMYKAQLIINQNL